MPGPLAARVLGHLKPDIGHDERPDACPHSETNEGPRPLAGNAVRATQFLGVVGLPAVSVAYVSLHREYTYGGF